MQLPPCCILSQYLYTTTCLPIRWTQIHTFIWSGGISYYNAMHFIIKKHLIQKGDKGFKILTKKELQNDLIQNKWIKIDLHTKYMFIKRINFKHKSCCLVRN